LRGAVRGRSTKIENDHRGTRGFLILGVGLRGGTISIDRELDAGALALDTTAFLLFAPSNLIDDEGREHLATSLS